MDEADRQLRSATAIGGTVRWVFSDQAATDAVSRLFNSDVAKGRNLDQVQIVVIPKK